MTESHMGLLDGCIILAMDQRWLIHIGIQGKTADKSV
jgi:hypothetical protein